MRYSHFVFSFLTGIHFLLIGCNQPENNTVTVTIHFPQAAFDTVIIGRTNMIDLDRIDLGKVRLDSAGRGTVEFELREPVFASGSSRHLNAGFYIKPGYRVSLVRAEKPKTHLLKFEGDGAIFNTYIREAYDIRSGLEAWGGKLNIQLDSAEFMKAKDSLQRSYDQLVNRMLSDKSISKDEIALMKVHIRASVFVYQYNFSLGKDSAEIPVPVRQAIKDFPLDTIALKTGVFDYALAGSFFFQRGIIDQVYKEYEEMDADSFSIYFPQLTDAMIKKQHFPKPLENYMRVKGVDYQIRSDGLNEGIAKLAASLEKEIDSDEYKKVIRADIARWEKIGPGKPAPNFTGTTPDGKQFALSDLKGKVVYVDIWATWCGPCVGEFPDSRKLVADFKGNDQVAFLYVSVDRDTLAWKKAVAANKVPPGIHVITGTDSPQSVWQQYHVWGIPRYLLIDAAGRMVATHAVRPSSGEVQGELKKLLSGHRVVTQ